MSGEKKEDSVLQIKKDPKEDINTSKRGKKIRRTFGKSRSLAYKSRGVKSDNQDGISLRIGKKQGD